MRRKNLQYHRNKPSCCNFDGSPCTLPSRYSEYLIIDQTRDDEDSGHGNHDAIVVNPMHVDFEDDIATFTESLTITEDIIDAINRFSQIYSKSEIKRRFDNMENFSMDSNDVVVVSDNSKEKYRYWYYHVRDSDIVPRVVISCEEKSYEIIPTIPYINNGCFVFDIRHPEFAIMDNQNITENQTDDFLVIAPYSDIDIEKKIAAFTDSYIVASNIMDLIDIFFLNSDKSIYR